MASTSTTKPAARLSLTVVDADAKKSRQTSKSKNLDMGEKTTANVKTNVKTKTVKTVKSKTATKAKVTTKKKAVPKTKAKTVVKKKTAPKRVAKPAAKKKAAAKVLKTKPRKVTIKKTSTTKLPENALAPTPTLNSLKSTAILKREPLGHMLVESMLREAGFGGIVSSDRDLLEKYSTDESIFSIRPQIILQPRNQHDVEVAVKVISAQTKQFPALSLTPRAAGTGLSGGSLTDSIVIDVCKFMHDIDSPQTSKGITTITAKPGAMWRDVEKILEKKGVYIPSHPASKDLCTVGGAVANNAAGPDSLRFGHCADWVESLNVTLFDGNTYTLRPLTYKEFRTHVKKENALSTVMIKVLDLIEKNEKIIDEAKPHTRKNSAGYALWDVLNDVSVAQFKKGKGKFDLTRLISGSQGTIGVIISVTMRTEPIKTDTELIVVPVFDLMDAGRVIQKALDFNPINVEIFDGLTFDLALSNPNFFRDRLGVLEFYKVMFAMYSLYHVRYMRKVPEFTLLITIDKATLGNKTMAGIVKDLQANKGRRARHIARPIEREMFWQIRRASYTLSKFQDKDKRPAAFLEDMTVPPKNLPKFFTEIKMLLKKYGVTAAVHGHGGNGHLHFYPLLDFTKPTTPGLVEKMAEEFFNTAVKYDGNICGEHNDGIIRTPHLNKMFSKQILSLFNALERAFDPDDIFNPGKKVNPRFDVKDSLRKTN